MASPVAVPVAVPGERASGSIDSQCGRRCRLVGPVGRHVIAPVLGLDGLGGSVGSRGGGSQSLLPGDLFLFGLFRIAVEEEIGHDVPSELAGDGAAQAQDLASQEPPHQADGMGGLVVARDGQVDEPEKRTHNEFSLQGRHCCKERL